MTRARAGLHAALLALALLAAQALGLAHRVAHGLPQAPSGAAASTAAAAATADATDTADTADTAEARIAPFSAHDPGDAECRLLDQAAHADALVAGASPALPPRVPTLRPAVASGIVAEVGVHAYLARGPPAGRRAGPRAT